MMMIPVHRRANLYDRLNVCTRDPSFLSLIVLCEVRTETTHARSLGTERHEQYPSFGAQRLFFGTRYYRRTSVCNLLVYNVSKGMRRNRCRLIRSPMIQGGWSCGRLRGRYTAAETPVSSPYWGFSSHHSSSLSGSLVCVCVCSHVGAFGRFHLFPADISLRRHGARTGRQRLQLR